MSGKVERNDSEGTPKPACGVEGLRRSSTFRGPVEPVDDRGRDDSTDHLALLYESRDERFAAVIPFLRQGLERGERCLYLADETPTEAIVDALRESGVDADAALESGALSIVSVEETLLGNGSFDVEESLAVLEEAVDAATDEFEGLRIASEETWLLRADEALREFATLKARMNEVLRDEPCIALCQYDRDQFPADILHDVIETHPYLVSDTTVSRNVYYTPPEAVLDDEDPDAKVDRMLRTVRERTEAKTALREHERYLRELHETTAGRERSFEETVERLLELGCERFDMRNGALAHHPADRTVRAEVGVGPELAGVDGELPAQPEDGAFCRRTIERDEPTAVPDVVEAGWEDDPVRERFGFETYFGIRVTAGTEPYGTLWFADTSPRDEPFTEDERTFLEVIGQWVSSALERRRRESELRRSKAQFERIFESSHDAIYINDPHADEILDANEAGCEMLGYSRTELLERGPSDFHPDEMERFETFVDEVYETGSGWTDELTCLHRDGDRIPVEMSASTIEYDGRRCLLAIVRDISDRKERERAQRRLYEIAADPDRTFEQKLQAVLDLGCERFGMDLGGLSTVDPDANRLEIEVVNGEHDHLEPGAVTLLSEGYCGRAVASEGPCSITDPVADGFEEKLCYERFGIRTYLGTHLELEGANDRTFWFVSNERRDGFSEAERTFHHLMGQWVKYELERQQYERDLEETVERLQQSNDRLKQFAYAASHDLREPLRMVSSYLQLLENRHKADLDEEAREFIDFAVDGASRMRAMIDDLLAFSRVEQADGEFESVDCDDVLERVTDDLQVRIDENDAAVVVESLPTIRADGEQLEQLFGNLVSNGIKYNESDVPRVEVSAADRGDRWVFAVADTGIGIESDKTDRIFEVFKRLHHDDEYPGTGIGLSLCQEIVENHDGDIRVESDPGEGSTFYVSLPKRGPE